MRKTWRRIAVRRSPGQAEVIVQRRAPRLRLAHLSIAAALVGGIVLGAANPAIAQVRVGAGVKGDSQFVKPGLANNWLRGYVKDTAADSACAEVWVDFVTLSGRHHDAYAVRICGSGRSGWGSWHFAADPRIRGIRTAVCTLSQTGLRKCSDHWPHLAARAGTYKLQTL